jgi:hypothetical protein
LDDCAILDVVLDGDSGEDDDIMGGYKQLQGTKRKFHGGVLNLKVSLNK